MSPPVDGGVEARVDTDAVERFVAESGAARRELAPTLANLRSIDDDVRATWVSAAPTGAAPTGAAPTGTALDGLGRLLARFEAHEDELTATRAGVLAADEGATRSLAGGGAVRASGVVNLPAPVATGRLGPWLDPATDSWVVSLARAPFGVPPTPALGRRLLRQGPGVSEALLRTSLELQPVSQVVLAATDPERFVANWLRAGRAGAEALAATAMLAAGTQALAAAPWMDEVAGRTIGRRPGRELLGQLRDGIAVLGANPDAFGASAVGWDDLQADPYRWLGGFAPDLLAEALGAVILGRGVTAARGGARTAEAAEALEALEAPARLNGAPGRAGRRGVVGGPTAADPPPRPLPDLTQYRLREKEWGPAGPIVSHREAPFEPPEGWVQDLNGGGPACSPGRRVNCIDTTRAAEANWRGQDAVAAPLRRPEHGGTSARRLEDWSGGRLRPATSQGVERRLEELGPGSSAMIVTTWDSSGAHAFNAVNDGGVVKWVDAQSGSTSRWPPPYASHFDQLHAIFIDAGGRPVGGPTP